MVRALQLLLEANEPAIGLEGLASDAGALRDLNQEIYLSLFSTYGSDRAANVAEQVAVASLELLMEERGGKDTREVLLELAFHGNLVTSGTNAFHRHLDEVAEAVERVEHENNLSRSSQYVRGLVAYARNDFVSAEEAFVRLPDVLDSPLLAYQAAYPAFRAPRFYNAIRHYESKFEFHVIQEPMETTENAPLLLCSADPLYFEAFAGEFIRNVQDLSSEARVHLHLINVPMASVNSSDLLNNDRVSITAEHSVSGNVGWYAIMARYMVLPYLMKLGNTVIVSDIDLVIDSDPATLTSEYPVVLGFSNSPVASYIPSTAILGGHNLFRPTDEGLFFAELLSRYLQCVGRDPRGVWVADQVALLCVYRMLQHVISVGDFRNVADYDYGPTPERPRKKEEAAEALRAVSPG